MSEKFLSRKQHDVLLERHHSQWMKENWSSITKRWSLGGVNLSNLSESQYKYLLSVFNRDE